MTAHRVTSFVLSSGLMILVAGCSGGAGGEDRLEVYPVQGKVTLAGSPVAGAAVTFSPVDTAKGRVAVGRTNDAGEYALNTYEGNDGAAAGDYIVLVAKSGGSSASSATPESAHEQYTKTGAPPSHDQDGGKGDGSLLPAKYASAGTSDLKATVTPDGKNTHDFALQP